MTGSSFKDELVYVSALNEFVYCPRRYYYQRYYDEIGEPYELVDGRSKHEHASHRGSWVTERYFRSDDLGMHGKIDLVDTEDGTPTPVERKRSESGSYYPSDEVQLAGYCMLLEDAIDEPVNVGYIYLYSTDTRHSIRITQDHRETVREILRRIQSMTVDSIPPLTQNQSKCEACSARTYCMPGETALLSPSDAEGTGWEGTTPGDLA
ncbi:CRISPR-associated RecB family exonuclease Cas4b [Halarchaeum acidiphilum MH1-52-1]|uniref:CRISPR-associated exonuclease Cas4 n=1 Tax=Halarchaeum acidiphilum MH1-52-1 TaxID=1261545 RepID=U3AFQ4_9EURY|nr:CRISPR-associated protein Cas4 [Halarchaeum acidiphilum]GAD53618.1 CRISPR-associated RecB family exonuclease Cas4b [Halarchaeum acidiphilum MH1-52-1]